MKYLNEAERPHQQLAVLLGTHCIVCHIFLCLECKEVDKTFGRHVTPHLYENCAEVFSVVYAAVTEFAFGAAEEGMMESELNLDGMFCNMW
jgi:hypothetical protein